MIVMLEAPVIEEILVKELLKYFYTDLQWDKIYPNYYIRFGNEYPWVPFINAATGDVDLSRAQESLFPSVTVTSNSDTKSPGDVFVGIEEVGLSLGDWTEQKALISSNPDDFIIADEAIAAIDSYFDAGDDSTRLYGTFMSYQKRDNVTFDIITDGDTDIKNRIYDASNLFLSAQPKIEIFKEKGINIIQPTISGSRSGEYNVEFGRKLHGCSINFQVDYVIASTFFDIDAGIIENVDITHNVEVKGEEV